MLFLERRDKLVFRSFMLGNCKIKKITRKCKKLMTIIALKYFHQKNDQCLLGSV